MKLSLQRLKECLRYDPDTGLMTWIINISKKCRAGKIAGSNSSRRYFVIRIDDNLYFLHRLAWLYVYGKWPLAIDHLDGNPLNNRINNLREATQSQNLENQHWPHKNNKCGILGVRFKKGKWEARIKSGDKHIYLGRFVHSHEAKNAYLKAKVSYHGLSRSLT